MKSVQTVGVLPCDAAPCTRLQRSRMIDADGRSIGIDGSGGSRGLLVVLTAHLPQAQLVCDEPPSLRGN